MGSVSVCAIFARADALFCLKKGIDCGIFPCESAVCRSFCPCRAPRRELLTFQQILYRIYERRLKFIPVARTERIKSECGRKTVAGLYRTGILYMEDYEN